jgi:hypothetical protein
METKRVLLTVQVLEDGSLLCDFDGSGEQLIEATAMLISGSVQMVEQTWLSAGKSPASARNAGQCAINRAAIKLDIGGKITAGRIQTRTQ